MAYFAIEGVVICTIHSFISDDILVGISHVATLAAMVPIGHYM